MGRGLINSGLGKNLRLISIYNEPLPTRQFVIFYEKIITQFIVDPPQFYGSNNKITKN